MGDRKGIRRFGDFSAPLDEALVHVVLVSPSHFLESKLVSIDISTIASRRVNVDTCKMILVNDVTQFAVVGMLNSQGRHQDGILGNSSQEQRICMYREPPASTQKLDVLEVYIPKELSTGNLTKQYGTCPKLSTFYTIITSLEQEWSNLGPKLLESNFSDHCTGFQDLSGRPYLGYNLEIPTQRIGNYDTQVIP